MITHSPTPSKVLYVSHVSALGGAERSLLDLIAGLDRQVYRPAVVLPAKGELSERLSRLGVDLLFCPALRTLGGRASLLRKAWLATRLLAGAHAIRELIRELEPAIVHANSTTAALFALCLPMRGRPPTLWHVRDLVLPRRTAGFLARKCDFILVPSACCRDLVRRRTGDGRVLEIPNGVSALAPAPTVWPVRKAPGTPVRIAMIAQLAAWKGHDAAIEVARQVVARRPVTSFLIVADERLGARPETLRLLEAKIDRVGLAGNVMLRTGTEEVGAILAEADILLHPAFPEPFGRVVVEAMLARRPVVAFGGPHGPAEIVRDGIDGFLAAPGSTRGLAEAIIALADNPDLRERMGRSGCARARERYGGALMVRRVQDVYRSLLSPEPPSP